MQWLVRDAKPNDSLFFHCMFFTYIYIIGSQFLVDSGHGGQTKDLDGDEDDGYDEVIYPVDFKTNGHIVDDVNVPPQKLELLMTMFTRSCTKSWSSRYLKDAD